jgi:HEAT repeat protein
MRSLAFLTIAVVPLSAAPVANHPKDVLVQAWAVLDESLQDGSPDHRQQALAALATLGTDNPEAVRRAVAALRDKHKFVRRAGAMVLGELKARSAIAELTGALDDSPEVALAAAESLTTLGDPKGREILAAVIAGDRSDTPGLFTNALRKAKSELHHPETLVLMGTQDAAGAMFGPAAIVIPVVKNAIRLEGKSAPGRVAAVAYLAKDPDGSVIQLLEWALKDDSRYVCLQAEQDLGARGNAGSIEKLEPLLHDEHTQLRVMAAASIIRIMDRDGEPGEVAAGPVAPVMQPKK